ncbi:hypothetical protein LDENG_00224210 [Lucifuga dentata]|nr:hypothetical protein LDENG_00224210 [Lucifuga dentata]
MSKVQTGRELVNQRRTAAFEETHGQFGRTRAEQEEELCLSAEEKVQQRKLLEAAFQPEVLLHTADVQQQERRSSLDQEEPEPSHIKKEEEEEFLISQEGELHDMEEADVTNFPFTVVIVKSEEDEEKVHSSQLQNQSEERRESESVSSSSTDQIKSEADDCGGPEAARNTYPGIHL